MTRRKVYERDTETMLDQMEQMLGDGLAAMKGFIPKTDKDIQRMEKLMNLVAKLRHEQRHTQKNFDDLDPEAREIALNRAYRLLKEEQARKEALAKEKKKRQAAIKAAQQVTVEVAPADDLEAIEAALAGDEGNE